MKRENEPTPETLVYEWWSWLYDHPNGGRFARRDELAKLRRLRYLRVNGKAQPDIVAALCIDSFRMLRSKIETALGSLSPAMEERLFIVAALLAHVRTDDKSSRYVADKLGGRDKDSRLLNEARFIRLIRVDNDADLFDQCRRLCRLLKNNVPVDDFVKALFWWNKDSQTRRRWADHYYGLFEESSATSQSS